VWVYDTHSNTFDLSYRFILDLNLFLARYGPIQLNTTQQKFVFTSRQEIAPISIPILGITTMKLHILIPVLIALHFSNSKIHCHQRKVSHLATSLCSVGLLLGTCAPFSFSVASADVGSVPGFSDVRGNLAQKAQKIPGFGPADVVFPKRFEGLWDVEQTVTAVIDNPREKNSFIDSLDGGAERKDLRLIAKLR